LHGLAAWFEKREKRGRGVEKGVDGELLGLWACRREWGEERGLWFRFTREKERQLEKKGLIGGPCQSERGRERVAGFSPRAAAGLLPRAGPVGLSSFFFSFKL
jgi:hypothetical protein